MFDIIYFAPERAQGRNDNIIMYNTKEECIKELKSIVKKNDVILIKASRGMKLEYVVKSLEEM